MVGLDHAVGPVRHGERSVTEDIDDEVVVPLEEDEFLAFWSGYRIQQQTPTKVILGVVVPIPDDIPLAFESTFKELEKSEDIEDIKHLLGLLFGQAVIDAWFKNGLTVKMLQILLAWGMSCAMGKNIEFAEAVTLVEKAEADKAADEGKAPAATNRAARRASSKTAVSGAGGAVSSRTSRASTGSSRKTSR